MYLFKTCNTGKIASFSLIFSRMEAGSLDAILKADLIHTCEAFVFVFLVTLDGLLFIKYSFV